MYYSMLELSTTMLNYGKEGRGNLNSGLLHSITLEFNHSKGSRYVSLNFKSAKSEINAQKIR